MAVETQYDVFLSHSSTDKPTIEELASRLKDEGISVFLDKWHLVPGEPWQEGLEEALAVSQTVAVFLGPTGIGSWQNEEMRSALEERVRDKSRRVIPVLLPGAPDTEALQLPRFLRRLTWVDMRTGLDDEEAFRGLVAGIRGEAPGRGPDKGESDGWPRYWNEGLKHYLEHMKALHSTIRVLGHPKPVPLEGIYTDLYILNRPSASRHFDINQLREDPSVLDKDKRERVNGLEFIARPEAHRLFILGKPGAGKTTFLKYVALQAAEGKLDRVPIFVSLRRWSDLGLGLMAYISREFKIGGFPKTESFIQRILEEGRAIVLLDGLDEVNQEEGQRDDVTSALHDFGQQYLKTQCLITCRVAATEHQFEGFTDVEVADFTNEQVEAYVHRWFADDFGKGERLLADLSRDEHRGLRELARTPLLLSMLCLVGDDTGHLPQRRADVYEEALGALLKRWDASRSIRRDDVYRGLSVGRKRQMLAQIAIGTFERGEFFLPKKPLERHIVSCLSQIVATDTGDEIDGESVLKAIEAQNGILVERAHGIYAFAHLIFQEYFAAAYLANPTNRGELWQALEENVTDDRWREVFLFAASLLIEVDDFFEHFVHVLDKMVAQDAASVALVQWVEKKTFAAEGTTSPLVARISYLALALEPMAALALDLQLDHTVTLALSLARASIVGRDRITPIFAIAHTHSREGILNLKAISSDAPGLALDLALARARAVGLNHASSMAMPVARFLTPTRIPSIDADLALARRLSKLAGLSRLHRALEGLMPPVTDASEADWRAFVDTLQAAMSTHRGIFYRWAGSARQAENLAGCLTAVRLFVDCMDVSNVSNRAALRDRLLRAPVAREGE